jgi:uncharacterized Zn finger protein
MATITLTIQQKAERLVNDGKITPLGNGRFTVEGDHGLYDVRLVDAGEAFGWCDCPATARYCSHLVAAAVYLLAHPEPAKKPSRNLTVDPFEGLNDPATIRRIK